MTSAADRRAGDSCDPAGMLSPRVPVPGARASLASCDARRARASPSHFHRYHRAAGLCASDQRVRQRRQQTVPARRDGLRRRVFRLRQRRLARHFPGERHADSIRGRERKPTSYLFHNNRDGTFTDVTTKAGLTHSGWGQAMLHRRLRQRRIRRSVRHPTGAATFSTTTTATARSPMSRRRPASPGRQRWGAGCCFLDYDRDGHLDLFVANYVNFDPAKAPRPGGAAYCRYNNIPVPCGPQGFAGGTNMLYRNRGDGTFDDVSEESGIARPRGSSSMAFVESNWRPAGSYGMGAAAADFDNDGWPDIYVACDSAPSLLYRNNHDGTFREIAVPAGCAFDENGVAMSGMGVGVADYDGDGWLDIVRTNFSEQLTTIYRNFGGAFEDASIKAGMGVNRKYLGFGVGFLDFDNDGWKDIFIANGHVYSQIADREAAHHIPAAEAALPQSGQRKIRGRVSESRAGGSAENLGRGCAFGDFDNDGDVDIVINNLDGPPSLLRNDGGNRQQLDR